MKKPFCDICEQPATERHSGLEVGQEIGPMFETTQTGSTGFRKTRTEVRARVEFAFKDHRGGSGGPPDLCDACVVMLLEKALGLARVRLASPPDL